MQTGPQLSAAFALAWVPSGDLTPSARRPDLVPALRVHGQRHRVGIVVGSIGIFAVSMIGCGGDDVFDPSGSAEIGIHDQIELELDLDSEVVCTEPPTTDVGATFECVATDEAGKSYTFVAEILPDE
eukprot:gene23886-44494_t